MKTPTLSALDIFITGMCLLLIAGCSKKEENEHTLPILTTSLVSGVKTNSATCGGTITSDGGDFVTQRGVCWSKTPAPLITDAHTTDGTGTGGFSSEIMGLDTNTLYYVRAYASNSLGTAYGNTQSFTTLKMVVYGVVTDIDGNQYNIIKIGSQFWTDKNLRVTRYSNGDIIPDVKVDAQWKTLTTGAYCDYNNLQGNDTIYGKLYNWHALNDMRGLCPAGWHIPSDSEWATLTSYLGGNEIAGGKLKSTGNIEAGTGLWYAPNAGADNSTGFKGLPGGYRINYGTFYSLGNVGYFWSKSDTASLNGWNFVLDANNAKLLRNFNLKTNGFSVRCCRD